VRSRTRQIVKRLFPLCFLGLVVFSYPISSPATETDGPPSLPGVYEKWKECLAHGTPFGVPLRVESVDRDGRIVGKVYGLFDEDMEDLAKIFCDPVSWGEIAILHLNVKGFAARSGQGKGEIILYVGRKYYQPLARAHQLRFRHEVETIGGNALQISLTGDQGACGGRNDRLRLEALSVGPGQSFVCITYACELDVLATMMVSGYFRTLGRKKIGFTVVGVDKKGCPIHVRGLRGLLERNAMRYYLAVRAYLDTRHVPEEDRFEKRLNRWFDLTEGHHAQLYEYDRAYYLACKKKERENSLQLQRSINQGKTASLSGCWRGWSRGSESSGR
jgi:hypothetical protein